MNLLIIEDDPMVAYIHQKYLEKLIHQPTIFTVATIAEGLQLTKEKQPVLVLLDVHLKDGNGLKEEQWQSIAESIRDEKIDTEVILITAANELENVKRSLHLGVLDYLVKPFSFERFQQSIENYQKKAAQFTLETKELSQTKVDQLFHSSQTNARKNEQALQNMSLEKGLTQATLQLLLKKIDEFTDYFTIQELSEASQLSHVSVRKYVLFLEKNNLLESKNSYLKVGRPYQSYRRI